MRSMKEWIKQVLSADIQELEKKVDRQQKKTGKQLKEIDLKVYRNGKAIEAMRTAVKEEFRRRDIWALRDAEVQRLAAGKKIWVIKCPAPDSEYKYRWGDYSFCMTLKRYLEKEGFYVVVDCYEDWYCNIDADVVLVIRGLYPYHPDRRNTKCKYILWEVSHPEIVSMEEYDLYDLVYVNSVSYAQKLENQVHVPVLPLMLCADTDLFFPGEEEIQYERVFVGNSRGVRRKVVSCCYDNGIELDVWGDGWEPLLDKDGGVRLHGPIANEKLPELYRASGVILNDHWDDMKEYGFVNNRILEALCCGAVVISDYNKSYEKLFGDVLVFYEDEEDFLTKIEKIRENEEEIRQKVRAFWPVLKKEYSFAARASQLHSDYEKLCREEKINEWQ